MFELRRLKKRGGIIPFLVPTTCDLHFEGVWEPITPPQIKVQAGSGSQNMPSERAQGVPLLSYGYIKIDISPRFFPYFP